MRDGTLPLQRALMAALDASDELRALVGPRVYDEPPANDERDDLTALPYVVVGDFQSVPFARDGLRGCSVYFSVHNWAEARDEESASTIAKRINAAVSDAAWGLSLQTVDGWLIHRIWADGAGNRVLRELKSNLAHGVAEFRADMTPAPAP